MKIWLDDVRPKPHDEWIHVKNVGEAMELIGTIQRDEDWCISFDHDLGEKMSTGYDLASWIERLVYERRIHPPVAYWIHSANPTGRANIAAAMLSMERWMHEQP